MAHRGPEDVAVTADEVDVYVESEPGDKDAIQLGFWTYTRVFATKNYMIPMWREMEKRKKDGTLRPMTPAIKTFKDWINANSVCRMWVHLMLRQGNDWIREAKKKQEREVGKDGDWEGILHYDGLFDFLNEIISTSPGFNETVMVGTPMNGLFAIMMATDAGLTLFHDEQFNVQFKKVLDAWNTFLKSSASLDKLDIDHPEKPGSWISKAAVHAGVWTQMVHDKSQPGWGYDSWNAFFIREFVAGARPFHGEAREVVNIGCETTPWRYENNVHFESHFWVKHAPYSLVDLLGGSAQWAEEFQGGQLYQGFLSATHYHRWQAPLDGTIVRSWVEPGTYFAQRPGQGENQGTWEGTASQPYLGHVATRAVFIFKHENPSIGYVAMICIGMVEVSTCVINASYLVGQSEKPVLVNRGDPIGNFEFGGSTHVMIFQKDRVNLQKWAVQAKKHQNDKTPTPLGTVIATVAHY